MFDNQINFFWMISLILFTAWKNGDIDFIMTKNKIRLVFPDSSTCCSMCNCSVIKITTFLKDIFRKHKEFHNLGWCASYFVNVLDETVMLEFKNKAAKRCDNNNDNFLICNCYYCKIFFYF